MGLALTQENDFADLRKMLGEMIELLKKANLLPANVEKDKLVNDVMKTLMQDKGKESFFLTKESLKNPQVRQSLAVACIGQHTLGDKFDSSLIFSPAMKITQPDVANQLKTIFDKMLELKLKDNPKSANEIAILQKKLHGFADQMAPQLMMQFKKLNEKDLACENKPMMETLTAGFDACSDLNRQFYGNDIAGGVPKPVLGVVGNLIGALDLETNTAKPSFMSDAGSSVGADPLGTKMDNLVAEVAKGSALVDTPAELKILQDIMQIINPEPTPTLSSRTPFHTKPLGPGEQA